MWSKNGIIVPLCLKYQSTLCKTLSITVRKKGECGEILEMRGNNSFGMHCDAAPPSVRPPPPGAGREGRPILAGGGSGAGRFQVIRRRTGPSALLPGAEALPVHQAVLSSVRHKGRHLLQQLLRLVQLCGANTFLPAILKIQYCCCCFCFCCCC